MSKKLNRVIAFTLASAISCAQIQMTVPVQAATEKEGAWYEEVQWDIPSLKGNASGEYIISPNSENVPVVSESMAPGLKGVGTIPSAYMNTLSQLLEKYPATRSQGAYNTCWSFSAVGLAEFDLITDNRSADNSIDLSELQLAYFTYHNAEDPFGGTSGDGLSVSGDYRQAGGNLEYCARTLLQWEGVIRESDMPYTDISSLSEVSSSYAFKKDVAHLQNAYIINIHKNPNSVKKQIMEHGAAGIGFHFADSTVYDGMTDYGGELVTTYYCPSSETPNHAANIVGWDDDFPASAFSNVPEGNGAWLVRNSWSDEGKNDISSYFWLSYYDRTLEDAAWIFDFDSADNYDYIYQYDGCPYVYKAYPFSQSANVYKVQGTSNELLKAVSIALNQDSNVPYTIKIYTNLNDSEKPKSGVLATQVSGKTTYAGTYTIPLNKAVSLPKGSYYSIVVELGKKNAGVAMECAARGNGFTSTASIEYNQSFVYYDGQWQDLVDVGEYQGVGNLCIKGYTDKTGTSLAGGKKLRASSATRTSAKLSWSGVSGAQGYEIYRAASKNGTYKKVKAVKGKTYKNTGLTKGKTYYYKVRPYKIKNGEKIVGKLSSAVKVTTKK